MTQTFNMNKKTPSAQSVESKNSIKCLCWACIHLCVCAFAYKIIYESLLWNEWLWRLTRTVPRSWNCSKSVFFSLYKFRFGSTTATHAYIYTPSIYTFKVHISHNFCFANEQECNHLYELLLNGPFARVFTHTHTLHIHQFIKNLFLWLTFKCIRHANELTKISILI